MLASYGHTDVFLGEFLVINSICHMYFDSLVEANLKQQIEGGKGVKLLLHTAQDSLGK